ncbi:hypothetical protein R2B67_15005 [Streptomyces cyaneofuscatus]|uniref:hypothetical protein n=1 Tax=Streptomyces cyaneofuscatus TaxID=66883 RepID=UPI00295585EE|nr:hypothetical protein [Streptomyces cyaneofuscatus]WOP09792.1 hypothetical protein R2B67_15005 [Streptomyces cyaneofuscatus]
MASADTYQWWELLPAGIRRQVDGYVLQDSRMQAIRIVLEAGRARGLGLHEAQLVVHDRYLHHGDRVARTPDSPLDVESLAARAAGCPGRVVAIEAVWDGDTVHDWFVHLMAITDDPVGERSLATIYWGTAVRYLGEERAPGSLHPSAAVADRSGRALAARLSVPFHFASPETPDDEAPRWRPEAIGGQQADK